MPPKRPPRQAPLHTWILRAPAYVVFPHQFEHKHITEANLWLWLSAAAPLAIGSHSYVYRAELVLLWLLLVNELICLHCVLAYLAD
jgi:hypothetical protein